MPSSYRSTEGLQPQVSVALRAQENPLYRKHFTDTNVIETREQLLWLFELIAEMKQMWIAKQEGLDTLLMGKMIMLAFVEASSRTNISFLLAAAALGSKIANFPGMDNMSSFKKGESVWDTARVLGGYRFDLIVLRHPDDDSSEVMAKGLDAQGTGTLEINAGAGKASHPSQALLDMFTIYEQFGRLDNLKISMVGDMKFGRTVKSLAELFAHMGTQIEITFISPVGLDMPVDFIDKLVELGVTVKQERTLDTVGEADVLYVTRAQVERMTQQERTHFNAAEFVITPEVAERLKPDALLMHPLPRQDELPIGVDSMPQAAYFDRQAPNGVPTRMALMLAMLVEQPFMAIEALQQPDRAVR